MAHKWTQFDKDGYLKLETGEKILSITPEDIEIGTIWWALIQMPCEIVDFAKEKEKRKL